MITVSEKMKYARPGAVWQLRMKGNNPTPRTIQSVDPGGVTWEPVPGLHHFCSMVALARSHWAPVELIEREAQKKEARATAETATITPETLARVEAKLDRVLALLADAPAPKARAKKKRSDGSAGKAVLAALVSGPATKEEILRRSGLTLRAVTGTLRMLAHWGRVTQVGDRYSIVSATPRHGVPANGSPVHRYV